MKFSKFSIALLLISICLLVFVIPVLIPSESHHFKRISETKSDPGDIPVVKYRSEKTGLHLIFAEVEGPMIGGYFTIPTEAESDDGLPHVLEHLVFLGSEGFPYKAALNLLANRCFASGTGGLTYVDYTAYTVRTAGKEGFLNLLPILLDHIFFPTLKDEVFLTEVYHITGSGEEAGVVFSERQAREKTGNSLTYLEFARKLYPAPSGLRYETGGLMDNLRNLTIDKVREYHKLMYRPENFYIIITGQIEHSEVFKAIEGIELKLAEKEEKDVFQRPWQDPVPPLTKSVDIEIHYPSSVEHTGIVRVGWRGPSTVTDLEEYLSMEIITKYLTATSVSPVPATFIDVGDPLASYIQGSMLQFSVSSCSLIFQGVPKRKISKVFPLLKETLKKIANGTIPIDLKLMKNTLTNQISSQSNLIEINSHYLLSNIILQDVIYGNTNEYLDKLFRKKLWFETLMTKPASYWQDLIKKYMISSPSVVVRGVPSLAESKKLQEEEKRRKEERKERLGEEGLKQLAEKVARAKKNNEIPPPDRMLQSVPVPSTSSIQFHSLDVFTNIRNHSSGKIPPTDPALFNLSSVPVKIQVDDINSNFVQVVAILDTRSLTSYERLYLPLLTDLLLESPLLREDEVVTHGNVLKGLVANTIQARTIKGLHLRHSTFSFGEYFQNVGLNFKMTLSKYAEGVAWLSDILFRVAIRPDRVSVKVRRLLNSIPLTTSVVNALFMHTVYKNDTNKNRASPVRQETFLLDLLKSPNKTKAVTDLEKIYKKITNLDQITIHMTTNLKKLAQFGNITEPWTKFASSGSKAKNMSWDVVSDFDERRSFTENRSSTGHIIGMDALESTYMFQVTSSISNFNHEDLPVLMTVTSYLAQIEGPMWKQIRGRGLSYNYKITQSTSSGILSLWLNKNAQLIEAYKEALNIINSYLNGTEKWNQILFESAKSSLIYGIVKREEDISDVVQQSVLAYYRKVPHDFNKSFLKALEKVKLEDLDRVAQKYLRPMITPSLSQTGIVCPSSKVEEIKSEFNKLGHDLTIISSLADSSLSKI